jgi:dTDP-glucose pyrophosphorylase/predicted transcriptional regulator
MESDKTLSKANAWTDVVLSTKSSVGRVVQVLNDTGLRIVLIVDEDGILVGTISDGDIRRGLLKCLDLKSDIESIIHYNPLVVTPELSRNTVSKLMVVNKVQQIPIINEKNQVIGLHIWDEMSLTYDKSNIIVIMAGGRGIRLHPQTENCPKPMLLLADKPILEHIIMNAKLEGFSYFVIAIHYLGNVIEDYFGDVKKLGVKIEYLRENSPLGTAGALSLLNPPPINPIIVTNGDIISDIKYAEILEFHAKNESTATMAVRLHEYKNPFGVVQTQGFEIIGYDEKPIKRDYINAGVYVLEPSTLRNLPYNSHYNMPDLFEVLRRLKSTVIAYPIHEPWIDIGQPRELKTADTNAKLKSGEHK